MASVYQHSRGKTPYWIAVFTDESGKRCHRSTKTTDRTKATATAERYQRMADTARELKDKSGGNRLRNGELVLESFITATQKAAEGTFSEHDAREVMNRTLEATGQNPMNRVSAREFLIHWIESKEISKSAGTAARYRHTVETFLTHLGRKADSGLITLTARDIQDFRDLQLKEGKANTTANMVVKTLRIPLNVARRQGLILTNPAEAVDMVDSESAERQVFTPEQIKTLLNKADAEWKGLILLGACAGMRIGDAARTTWANVDFETKVLRFFPQKTARKANRKPLEVVMLPDVESWLLSHPATSSDPNAPLFKTLHKKPVGGKVGLSESFLDLMKEAGVDKTTVVEKKEGSKGRSFNALTFHSLRHTFVSTMTNMGVSQEIRMKLAGHTSDVHQRYTHHELGTLRSALKKFPKFL